MTELKRGKRKSKPVHTGILLDDDYRIIRKDKHNMCLQEYILVVSPATDDEPEKERMEWKEVTYHNAIPDAIRSYARLRQNKAESFDDLLAIMEDINIKIDSFFEVRTDG